MGGAEVTRHQMLWKAPGLAVEEVSLLTSTPTFQTRSQASVRDTVGARRVDVPLKRSVAMVRNSWRSLSLAHK